MQSDSWWWRKIFSRISDSAELLIYNDGEYDEKAVISKFFESCCLKEDEKSNISKVTDNIFVISFRSVQSNRIKFLQF